MHFAHPQNLWGLLLIVAFATFAAGRERVRVQRLAAFASSPMQARLTADFSARRAALKTALVVAALALLVVAAAGPQWGTRMVTVQREGIDVMLAVDCSTSMNAKDVKPSRLELARIELSRLAKELEGNRLGLVGFAGCAYVFCPLTLDISATHLFLDQLDTGSLPIPGTAMGEAIRAAMQAFPEKDANKKVIVLLTDGEDHRSDPIGAAKEAAKAGITIYTVGIGNPNGEPIPEKGPDGREDFVRDPSGKVVMSRLDDATLKEIARLTGGTYVHVDGATADALAPILAAVGNAEKSRLEEAMQRRYVERFQWFVLAAVILLGLERLISTRRTTGARLRTRGATA